MVKVFEIIAIVVMDKDKEQEDTLQVEEELAKAGNSLRNNGVLLADLKIKVLEKK